MSLERDVFPALLENGYKIAVFKGCKYWMEIGTPEKYLQTHEDIMAGDCHIAGVHFDRRGVYKGDNSTIDTTVDINGPVYIGNNVTIEAFATIGPNTVIGDDVCIHAGGSVINSILWNRVNLESFAEMYGIVAALNFKVDCSDVDTIVSNERVKLTI